jgi:hypothetical protein
MESRIADTFTDSLAPLTGEEPKAVKTTAFDLQINPASPGMSFHRLAKARDKGFWSIRVSQDVRLIVHRTAQGLLLCYVDHHDRAYFSLPDLLPKDLDLPDLLARPGLGGVGVPLELLHGLDRPA